MAQTQQLPTSNSDDAQFFLSAVVQRAGLPLFARKMERQDAEPRKFWITPDTWAMMKERDEVSVALDQLSFFATTFPGQEMYPLAHTVKNASFFALK